MPTGRASSSPRPTASARSARHADPDRAAAMQSKRVKLGEILLEKKLISEEQLAEALREQNTSGRKLGRVLIDIGAVSEQELHRCLAEYLDIPYVDLAHMNLDPRIVSLLPETHARRYRALVIRDDTRGLLVGMADPTDLFAYDELTRILGRPIHLALVREAALLRTIDVVYRRTEEIYSLAEELDEELSRAGVDVDMLSAEDGSPDAPVIKLIQSMFYDAVRVNASDIHIEPGENCLRIRLRVDGMLQEQIIDGHRVGQALVTRIKLMCGLDISEKRKPQDGRFSIRANEKQLDVRVATLPIYSGEAVVLRLLDQSAGRMSFDELGMPEETVSRFKALIERTAGMILVAGPTGSGKTTTLYAALNHVNLPARKIITAEDPVEYRLERINQVQVNARIGLDFATVLRSALRQDPDIVLVGEMRDHETVEMGLRAAMTGHLVLSTLHTTNAISTVSRLLDMDAPGFLIASSLSGILAQRLLRRLCDNCVEPAVLTPQQQVWMSRQMSAAEFSGASFQTGAGCTYCNMTGYRGRIGIYEWLEIDAPLADAIRAGDLTAFARLARSQRGFVPLVRRGIDYALAGTTSPEELMRVSAGLEEPIEIDLVDEVLESETASQRAPGLR
jgi:MSHA biogenesis protein MshE